MQLYFTVYTVDQIIIVYHLNYGSFSKLVKFSNYIINKIQIEI